MASRESIEFDFKKAKEQAKKLDEVAERLNRLSNQKFSGTMQQLSSVWKGENATLYLNKGDRLQEKMNATVRELQNIASDIRVVARRMYEAEMNALRIAQEREYR